MLLLAILTGICLTQERLESVDSKLDFLLIGDVGDVNDQELANQNLNGINKFVREASDTYEFFVELGDNLYDRGMTDVHDVRFSELMDFFVSRPYLRDIPIFPVLGNHDCLGDALAEVQVSEFEPTWEMPAVYYSKSYDIDKSREGDELGLLFLNSCMLICIQDSRDESCDWAAYQPSQEEILQHYEWIDETLTEMTNNNVIWKVLLIHNPLFTATDIDFNQKAQVKHLIPLIRKHNVRIFLGGHDHNLQFFTLDLDEYSQEEIMQLYEEKKNLKCGLLNQRIGEFFNPLRSRQYEASTEDNVLHVLVTGASGKHGLEAVCIDYLERNIGTLHYAHDLNPSFAAVHVTSESFIIEYYQTTQDYEYEKLYEFKLSAPDVIPEPQES